ncbi:MAG: universal stress protein [Planctomycetes bacterium]|nr:universal stress protein [Planctomycetota bacterium]
MTEPTKPFPSRIVCGVDLEGRAQHAVPAAVWLARTLRAPVDFVHAFPPAPILWGKEEHMPEWIAGTEAVAGALREALRVALAEAAPELGLAADASDLPALVRTGHPAQAVVEHARAVHADLVVLGSHKRRGRLDLGGAARGVLAHAPAVWTQPGPLRPVRRILAAVDAAPEARRVLEVTRDLASAFGARVRVVQAFVAPVLGAGVPTVGAVTPGYVIENLRARERTAFEAEVAAVDWRGAERETRFEDGEPADVLLGLQDEHDLIVMGTHGRTALSAALLGSVAQQVLREARIPVLSLRIARRTYLI